MNKVSIRKKSRRNEVGQKDEASNVFFQVICPGLPGFPGSLFLSTSNKRYLFNCSEGTQRLCVEHCVSRSLASLEHIFLTQKSWKTMGGLGGMSLAVKDSGSPDVTLHGPQGVSKIYDITKEFICLHDFDVLPREISSSNDIPPYSDPTITIQHLVLRKKETLATTEEGTKLWETVYKGYGPDGKLISNFVPEEIEYEESLPSSISIVYILHIKGRKGKLNLEKCLEKGVPPGPLLGKLKNGQDVTLENGEEIRSQDVKDEDSPGTTFIVVDVPSMGYMDDLLSAPIWQSLCNDNRIEGIFHFTPAEVLLGPEYQGWMDSFSSQTKHHMINDLNTKGYGTLGVATFLEKLSVLNPDIFSTLHKDNFYEEESCSEVLGHDNWVTHRIADRIVVRGMPPDLVTTLDASITSDIGKELESMEGLKDILSRSREGIGKSPVEENSSSFPHFLFLGTGSSIPSKYRAPSAILVELRPKEYMIMDCGEGTIIQLYRHFGTKGIRDFLRGLKCVYLSHLHADHHMGLIGIIKERQRLAIEIPLFIAAPTKLSSFFNQFHTGFENILNNLVQVQNEHALILPPEASPKVDEVIPQFKEHLGLSSFQTCRADHCVNSFCVKFVTSEGFHFIYTGDTRPTPGLMDLAQGSPPDLLIHEATMEHSMLEDAIKKRHSTFQEAINGGIALDAKATILTHFSQRYPKFPALYEIQEHPSVGFAFDFMKVNKSNFTITHHLIEALRSVFKEDDEFMATRREILEYKMQCLEESDSSSTEKDEVDGASQEPRLQAGSFQS